MFDRNVPGIGRVEGHSRRSDGVDSPVLDIRGDWLPIGFDVCLFVQIREQTAGGDGGHDSHESVYRSSPLFAKSGATLPIDYILGYGFWCCQHCYKRMADRDLAIQLCANPTDPWLHVWRRHYSLPNYSEAVSN